MARFLALSMLALGGAACGPDPGAPPPAAATSIAQHAGRPSFVVLVADDLGWGDVGFHGGRVPTPSLDRIAAEGLRLECLQTFALCTPTRAALLTGVDPMRLGLAWSPLRPWDDDGLPPAVPTLAERLRAAGYATACIGKWHLGHARAEQRPDARGFDRFYGCLNGFVDAFEHRSRDGARDWQRDGVSLDEQGYATRLLAAEAVRWLGSLPREQPFFLYLPFTAPHVPLQAPAETIARFDDLAAPAARAHAAMIAELDAAVGQVLAALADGGRDRDTLLIFLSDNGAEKDGPGSNGPFRGGKGSAFEGGVRMPAALRWPARVAPGAALEPGGAIAARLSVLDLAPTILAAAGLDLPGGGSGHDILAGPPPARTLFAGAHTRDYRNLVAVRWPWKYVHRIKLDGSIDRGLLFDLAADPAEQNDLAAAHPDVVAELAAALAAWRATAPAGGEEATDRTAAPPPDWRPPADWAERQQ